jgi:hypothetical protein
MGRERSGVDINGRQWCRHPTEEQPEVRATNAIKLKGSKRADMGTNLRFIGAG